MSITETDFLIVGQGLAGSLLAFSLIEKGQRVMVLDNQLEGSSSKVAAGTINPITGHRLNITERFNEYFPVAEAFYKDLEKVLKTQLFNRIQQTRLIKNAGQAEYFKERLNQREYQSLIEKVDNLDFVEAPYGCADVGSTAVIDTKRLLNSMREWLISQSAYNASKLDYQNLEVEEEFIGYQKIRARKLIFCEGYQAIHNPWLADLPFKLAKGEILTIEQNEKQNSMLSWGNWLVPSTNNSAKLGASFEWGDLDLTTSSSKAEQLLQSLSQYTLRSGRVLNHEVGIRPTTLQRKPFVGPLSNLPNSYCFNGLGSKGCLIAPYFAEQLTSHLLEQTPLPEEVTKWL